MGLWITIGVAVVVVLAVAALLDAHSRRRGILIDPSAVHARRKQQTRALRRSLLPSTRPAPDERDDP